MRRLLRIGFRRLDLELPTSCGVTLRILERPGLWMEPAERQELLCELREVARRGAGGAPLEYGILSGDKDRWDRAVLTVLRAGDTGRVVGFNAMSLLDVSLGGRMEEVLHLGLLVLDPEFRGRGFSRLVYGLSVALVLLRRMGRSFWVSSVSQVPAIVGLVARRLEAAYPGGVARPSDAHRQVAARIMERHRGVFGVAEDAGFDPERFVITDAYTGGSDNLKKSYSDAPKHRDPAINRLCERELDYARGDDFLQVARFTPRIALGCLRAFLVRSSVLAPLFGGAPALAGRRA